MFNKMRKRVVLIIIVLLLSSPVCALLLVDTSIHQRDSQYADFTHFQNKAGVQTYLESNLPIQKSTSADVNAFLENQQITHCLPLTNYSTKTVQAYDSELLCRVLAPRTDLAGKNWLDALWWRLGVQYFYDLDFYYKDGLLIQIDVRGADISL